MTRHPRLKSLLAVVATLAGLALLAAIGFGLRARQRADVAAATMAAVEARPRRLTDAWVRTTRTRQEAPRDERIAAGRRLDAAAAEALIPKTPDDPTTTTEGESDPVVEALVRFHVSGPESPPALAWRDVLANATDERLPEPPADLVAWLDDHEEATRRLARMVLESPTLAWKNEALVWAPSSDAADILAATLTLGAGVDAWRGRHDAAAEKLEAAWALRVALFEARPPSELPHVLLGALRCTRVPNPGEWLGRLQALDVRAMVVRQRLWSAKQRMNATAAEAEAEVPAWLPAPLKTAAVGIVKLPADWEAAVRVEHAAAAVEAIESLAPCDDPAIGVTPQWKRQHALSRVLPMRSSLTTSYALVVIEQDEAVLALTTRVLALREGRDVADPCDRVVTERAPEGRTTVRCTTEPHPLAAELGPWGARTFTFSPAPEPAPVLASAPLAR